MKSIFCFLVSSFFFVSCSHQVEIKTITTKELKVLLSQEKIQLLDVRSPSEIESGYIKTAKFSNYFEDDFLKISSKQLDKKKAVYLYCRTGNRSGKAAKILQENGFEVVNVLGGYTKWELEN